MDTRVAELAKELSAFLEKPPTEPTVDDRKKLMDILKGIQTLRAEPGVEIDASEEQRLQSLYMAGVEEAGKQLAFFNKGKKWKV